MLHCDHCFAIGSMRSHRAAGSKSYEHAQSAAGALGWRLTPDQVSALDSASDSLQIAVGLPFENW